jgi:hypothetical protein
MIRQPSSRTGENPPYGMIGGIEEIIRSPIRVSILPDRNGSLTWPLSEIATSQGSQEAGLVVSLSYGKYGHNRKGGGT